MWAKGLPPLAVGQTPDLKAFPLGFWEWGPNTGLTENPEVPPTNKALAMRGNPLVS